MTAAAAAAAMKHRRIHVSRDWNMQQPLDGTTRRIQTRLRVLTKDQRVHQRAHILLYTRIDMHLIATVTDTLKTNMCACTRVLPYQVPEV